MFLKLSASKIFQEFIGGTVRKNLSSHCKKKKKKRLLLVWARKYTRFHTYTVKPGKRDLS